MKGAAEFLLMAPHKLVLRWQLGQQSSTPIALENPRDERIAFKVKTTAPNKYSVKPAAGFLEPQTTAHLTVTMVAPKERPQGSLADCKDRFLVEALAVGPEVHQASSELFKSNASAVSGTKLRVVLMEPRQAGGSSGSGAPAAASPATAAKATGSQQQQQQQQQRASPTVASPAAAAKPTQLLPGASRLSKASPASAASLLQPPASAPREVLAAFAAAPPAPAAGAPPAAAAAAAAGAAAGGTSKYSASLRNKIAKVQAQQAQREKQQAGQPSAAVATEAQPLKDSTPPPTQQAVTQAVPAAQRLQRKTVSPQKQAAAAVAAAAEAEAAGVAGAPRPATAAEGVQAPVDGQQYVGLAVKKKFGDELFAGTVVEFVVEEAWWLIKYEDSDDEHIDFKELQRILVSRPAANKLQPQQQQQQQQQQAAAVPPAEEGQRQELRQERGASPEHSALASHHTELVPAGGATSAGAEDTAATALAARPTPQAAAVAAAEAAPPSTSRRPGGRSGRLSGGLRDAAMAPAEEPATELGSRGKRSAAKRARDELEGDNEDEGSAVAEPSSDAMAGAQQASESEQPEASEDESEEEEEEEEEEEMAVAGDSDSEYDPEQDAAQLAQVERREQRWVENQRRERSAAFTPATGVRSNGARRGGSAGAHLGGSRGGSRGGRTASSSPEESESDSEMAEDVGEVSSPRVPRSRRGGSTGGKAAATAKQPPSAVAAPETVDLLSDSSSDGVPAAVAAARPRTRESHSGRALPTLRLSFRAAAASDPGRQRLAVVRVRSCTPLRRMMEAVAAQCLDSGGQGADATSALALHLGRIQLDPGHTVRQAGLQDGDTVEVALERA